MKKLIASVLCASMLSALLVGCGGGDAGSTAPSDSGSGSNTEATTSSSSPAGGATKGTINLWSFTDEVPKMVDKFLADHPDFGYDVKTTIIATTEGAYQPALDQALVGGGSEQPDIYTAEEAFVIKYTQGDMASYAAPYEDLGIDVAGGLAAADIAQYTVDIGTNPDGKLVGLGYQATGGAFIYRRSLAQDTWGTDDPAEIAKKIGPGWDKFFAAADELKAKGYGIVSGPEDLWNPIKKCTDSAWIVDGKLNIDPKREEYIDLAKKLVDGGYSNDAQAWQDAWYIDMKGEGTQPIFGFFGPAWLINYVMAGNSGGSKIGEGTFGDWAVCEANVGYSWGGTWLLANTNSDKKEAIGQIIEWITLDCTKDGLQYAWANGTVDWDNDPSTPTAKDCVGSGTVMKMSDGSVDFLNGQNMFDVFVPANANASGKYMTQYDETINSYWQNAVRLYTSGEKSREEAIESFKQNVRDNLDVVVE